MKRFHIPAIDLLGRASVKSEMANRGYENAGRSLNSWVQRRKLPGDAVIMLLEMAAERSVELTPGELKVVDRHEHEMELAS